MAKGSSLRVATASESIQGVIDRGRMVDETIKNLTCEDKGIESILGQEAESLLEVLIQKNILVWLTHGLKPRERVC
jgi:hypothetical protein